MTADPLRPRPAALTLAAVFAVMFGGFGALAGLWQGARGLREAWAFHGGPATALYAVSNALDGLMICGLSLWVVVTARGWLHLADWSWRSGVYVAVLFPCYMVASAFAESYMWMESLWKTTGLHEFRQAYRAAYAAFGPPNAFAPFPAPQDVLEPLLLLLSVTLPPLVVWILTRREVRRAFDLKPNPLDSAAEPDA